MPRLTKIGRIHQWLDRAEERNTSLRSIISRMEVVGSAQESARGAALEAIGEIDDLVRCRSLCIEEAKRGQPAFIHHYRVEEGKPVKLACGLATIGYADTFLTGRWNRVGESFDCTGEWATTYGARGAQEKVVGRWGDHFLTTNPVGLYLTGQPALGGFHFQQEGLWAQWINGDFPDNRL